MKRTVEIILLAGGVFVSVEAALIKLHNRPQKPAVPAVKTAKPQQNRDANMARAFSLLDGVVQDAGAWNDAATIRVLTEIAGLTWSNNADYARNSLNRAFDALTQMVDEDKYTPQKYGESLLQKILAVAAQRDPQLAEELAAKFQEAVSRREAKATSAKSRATPNLGSASVAAQELMAYAASAADQQPDLAARLAESSLKSGISADLANVAARLREGHPDLAAQVLTAAVNTLNQSLRATVQDTFYVQGWIRNEEIGKYLDPAVLRQYFEAASRIVERDLNAPASPTDTYFMATQLLPLYDRYAPERSALIRTRLAELRSNPDVQRQEEKEQQLENRPRGPGAVEERLERARSAATDAEHDARLIGLASDQRRLGDVDRAVQGFGRG